MLDRTHELAIKRQAELVNLSRASVYYLPQPVSPGDPELMRRSDTLHLKHPLGARTLRDCYVGKAARSDESMWRH
jgi:putative transposase